MGPMEALYTPNMKLTNFSRMLGVTEKSFIALRVCPPKEVDQQLFEYWVATRDHERVVGNTLRAPGGVGAEVNFGMTKATGYAYEYAVYTKVPVENSQFAQSMNVLRGSTRRLRHIMLLDIEDRFRDAVDDTSAHKSGSNAVTLSGTDQWSDYDNSDPLDDVQTGHEAVFSSIGRKANYGWMSRPVWNKLKLHPLILRAVKYTGVTMASIALIMELFELDTLVIAEAQKNTALEGQADSMAYVWGKDFYMAYVNPSAGDEDVTFGWHTSRPLADQPSLREVVETKKLDEPIINMIRQRYAFTFNDVAMAVGATYLIKSAVA